MTELNRRTQRRRKQWIQENGPCKHCGTWEDLQIDHIDPATKDPALRKRGASIWAWSQERIDVELQKCQVLCKSCHKKKTALENSREITHGTLGGYNRGCRCDHCKLFSSNYNKQLRQQRKLKIFDNIPHGTIAGYGYYNCRCSPCVEARKIYELEWKNGEHPPKTKISRTKSVHQERKDKWFAENGPCKSCGSWNNLEVDHIDRSTKDPYLKKQGVVLWGWSEERRQVELAKCQVLCKACHREKTNRELTKEIVHGTHAGFVKGCKCDLCKKAKAIYEAERQKRKAPSVTEHGSLGYRNGCRCSICKIGIKDSLQLYRNQQDLKGNWIRENGPCILCKSTDDLRVDYITIEDKNPTILNMTYLWRVSKETRESELTKCQVLCNKCYTKKHSKDIIHGTVKTYWNGCKCALCKEARRNYDHQREGKCTVTMDNDVKAEENILKERKEISV